MSELKPCPFCESTSSYSYDHAENCYIRQVNLAVPNKQYTLSELYNTRPIEDALRARVDELEAQNENLKMSPDHRERVSAVKHMLEMTAFLRKIMVLGLLRGSPRLRDEALKILDGAEPSIPDVSVTQDVLMVSETSLSGKSDELRNYGDEVMEIIAQALSGDCERYLNYGLDGRRYCKWGIVEKDIRAIFEKGGEK